MNKHINEKTISYLSVLFCSLIFLSLVWNNNVWMDEAFTASLAHHSFKEVLILSMNDTLPPLYNIILWLTTSILGYSISVMKITSVLPMIGTLIIGATTVRKRHGLFTSFIFNMCITLMPLMLYYGVEIRMYSLGFFFATASGIFCHEVLTESNRKNWILFTVFSVLAGYSHHFAFVTVGFVYLAMLLHYFFADRTHLMRWAKCLGFTFVLYLPCMIVTLKQLSSVSGYFSMPDVTIPLFIQYAAYPYTVGITAATILCALSVFAMLCFFFYRFIRKIDRSGASIYSICCFCIYYGVLLFGTVVSKIMTANIFVDRYLFFSTGLLWLFFAIQAGKTSPRFRIAIVGIIAIIGLCTYSVEYKIEYSENADDEISFLYNNIGTGDLFFGLGGHEEMENCIPFYTLVSGGNELTYVFPLDTALAAAREKNVNLWISVMDGYEPTAQERELITSAGYTLEDSADFKFDRYVCKLYKAVQIK